MYSNEISSFFKESSKVAIFIGFSILIVWTAISQANDQYLNVISGKNNFEIVIRNSSSLKASEKNLVLILKNNEYYFLYNDKTKKAIVVQKNEIEYVSSL